MNEVLGARQSSGGKLGHTSTSQTRVGQAAHGHAGATAGRQVAMRQPLEADRAWGEPSKTGSIDSNGSAHALQQAATNFTPSNRLDLTVLKPTLDGSNKNR